jgi:DNA polymerase III gamma/tau subunit
MKKLFILVMACTLHSCCLFKRAAEPDHKTNIKSDTEVSTDTDETQNTDSIDSTQVSTKSVSDQTFDQLEQYNASWSTSVVSYDTSKPIDINTGKPPILSESTTTYNADSHKENKTVDKSKTDIVDKSVKKSNTTTNTKVKSKISIKVVDKSSTSTQSTPWWKWMLGGIGLASFGFVVWKTRSLFV